MFAGVNATDVDAGAGGSGAAGGTVGRGRVDAPDTRRIPAPAARPRRRSGFTARAPGCPPRKRAPDRWGASRRKRSRIGRTKGHSPPLPDRAKPRTRSNKRSAGRTLGTCARAAPASPCRSGRRGSSWRRFHRETEEAPAGRLVNQLHEPRIRERVRASRLTDGADRVLRRGPELEERQGNDQPGAVSPLRARHEDPKAARTIDARDGARRGE